jgi:hypothetical protein
MQNYSAMNGFSYKTDKRLHATDGFCISFTDRKGIFESYEAI